MAKQILGATLYTRLEAMAILGVSEKTLKKHMNNGLPYRKIGNTLYFEETALRAWLRGGAIEQGPIDTATIEQPTSNPPTPSPTPTRPTLTTSKQRRGYIERTLAGILEVRPRAEETAYKRVFYAYTNTHTITTRQLDTIAQYLTIEAITIEGYELMLTVRM